MDKKYLQLFTEMCKTMSVLAEQVMDYNHSKGDDSGFDTAKIMRDDYDKLYDRMRVKDFDDSTLERQDYARLLVGAIVVSQNIQDQIKAREKAVQGYKIDVIPKLERVVNETEDSEGARKIADEVFQIAEEEN